MPRTSADLAKRDCAIISTPHDTFEVVRLLIMSMPVRERKMSLTTSHATPAIDDARKEMFNSRHRFLPYSQRERNFSRFRASVLVLNPRKKHVILA